MLNISSLKDIKVYKWADLRKNPNDYEEFFLWICDEFNCSILPIIERFRPNSCVTFLKEQSGQGKRSIPVVRDTSAHSDRKERRKSIAGSARTKKTNWILPGAPRDMSKPLFLVAIDEQKHFTEMIITKSYIPLLVMQCFGAAAGACVYLNKLTIDKCVLNEHLMFEMSYIIAFSFLTNIFIVDCEPFPELNYYSLLEKKNNLEILSIRRCQLNDRCVKLIAAKLSGDAPSTRTLRALNLSSNHITDEGAVALADALRTNRKLQGLSLANNRIGDRGCLAILSSLCKFKLTYDELRWKRHSLLFYYENYQDIQSLKVPDTPIGQMLVQKPLAGRNIRKTSPNLKTNLKQKTKDLTNKVPIPGLGSHSAATIPPFYIAPYMFINPFQPSEMIYDNNSYVCKGNMSLAYLNMAFNHIELQSLRQTISVIKYQNHLDKSYFSGLRKVIFEGNNLPRNCPEYLEIKQILNA